MAETLVQIGVKIVCHKTIFLHQVACGLDYEAGRRMVEQYAVKINPDLHKEIKDRYATLDIAPYKGFVKEPSAAGRLGASGGIRALS